MLTVYHTAESLLDSVKLKIAHTYPRPPELLYRLELLERMLTSVPPEQLVAVDEEMFAFLDL